MFKGKKSKFPVGEEKTTNPGFMGMDSPEEFEKEWHSDPFRLIAYLVTEAPGDNDTSLAFVIYTMIMYSNLSPAELGVIGLDNDEIGTIIDTVKNNSTFEEFEIDLKVRAAVREYDKVIFDIMITNSLNQEMYDNFRKELCKFASDNSITDLNIAFKFYSTTEIESFAKYKLP